MTIYEYDVLDVNKALKMSDFNLRNLRFQNQLSL